MEQKLEKLRDQLSDLSKRNRSLRLLRLYDKWSFDLSKLNDLQETKCATAENIVNHILHNKDSIFLLSRSSMEEEAIRASYQLTSLYRNVISIKEQTGVEDLYVGYPFISGKMADGTFIQAPVFLFPVRLVRQDNREPGWLLHIESKEEVLLNRTLLLAFQKYNNLKIDEEILEDAKEMPKDNFQQWTSELFQRYGIDLYWAKRKIMPLHQYRQKQLPNPPDNFLAITPYCILGYFSQGNTSLLKDYDELIERYEQDPDLGLVNELLQEEVNNEWMEVDLDPIDEKECYDVTDLDASQEEALINTYYQKGLVIHGPPGTGKSQLIVNLIATAMARNEKILVVCQKRAALDVVYQRLEMLGLSDQVALVHDVNGDRKSLYQKINTILKQKRTTNIEDKEQEYEKICKDLDQKKEYFAQVAKGIGNKHSFGLTGYELYSRLSLLEEVKSWIPISTSTEVDFDQLEKISNQIFVAGRYIGECGYKKHPWFYRKPFTSMTYQNIGEGKDLLSTLVEEIDQLHQFQQYSVTEDFTPKDCWKYDEGIQAAIDIIEKYQQKPWIKKMNLFFWSLKKGKLFLQKYNPNFSFFQMTQPELEQLEDKVFQLKAYGEQGKKIQRLLDDLSFYFQDHTIDLWKEEVEKGTLTADDFQRANESIDQDFDSLVAMDQWIQSFTPEAKLLFEWLQKEIPEQEDADNGDRWKNIIEKSFYMSWVDRLEGEYTELKTLTTGEYETHWQDYQKALQEKQQYLPFYLKERLQIPVQKLKQNHVKQYRDIHHQVNKTRKIWPIRKLIYQYWEKGIFDILPIWLVSPETVSTIFPMKKGMFDKVIFDEASQCKVEHGIPSFYRATQVIVAGDEKQLAPFDLFHVGLDMEEEEIDTIFEGADSLLTLTKRQYPTQLLAWHYRSKYEELIHFSNYAFYNGQVQIAPNIGNIIDPPPIEWKMVDGLWEDQMNQQEALEVCQKVKELFMTQPESSIGIITFNKKQQDLIFDLIEEQIQEDEEFATLYDQMMKKSIDERLFIKNIENVQGDERDIIIFSIGYGRNPEGKVSVNFGILNKAGGENRLNVAVSRAKEKMIIFSSVHPREFDVSQSKNIGPRLLKQYLLYAYAIAEQNKEKAYQILHEIQENDGNVKNSACNENQDDIFITQVVQALEKRGYEVHTNIGNSQYKIDIGILDPSDPTQYIVGIQTDGPMYQKAHSVKEREIYHQRFLESKGWKMIRIWSRNWWKDKAIEMKKIESYIQGSKSIVK